MKVHLHINMRQVISLANIVCCFLGILIVTGYDILDKGRGYITVTSCNDTLRSIIDQLQNEGIKDLTINCSIDRIPADVLAPDFEIESLTLSENEIRSLSESSFCNNSFIRDIYLDNNFITELPPAAFCDLENLQTIKVSYNNLKTISADSFRNTPNVKYFYLDNNKIEDVVEHMFSNLPNLVYITMVNNRIKRVASEAFLNAPLLTEIYLSGNKIEELPDRAFSNLDTLEYVILYNNTLRSISEDTFWETHSLSQVDLRYNRLSELPYGLFTKQTRLSTILLTNNPWHCDCKIQWIIHHPNVAGSIKCATPPDASNATNVTRYFAEHVHCAHTNDDTDIWFLVGIVGVLCLTFLALASAFTVWLTKLKCTKHAVFPKIPMMYNMKYHVCNSSERNDQTELSGHSLMRDNLHTDLSDDLLDVSNTGRLRLKRVLGEGAFGDVYEGETSYDEGKTWVKVAVKRHRGDTGGCLKHLVKEFKLLYDVGSHPNVITVHGCTVIEGAFLMIMELADNGDLHTFLRTYAQKNGHLIQNLSLTDEKSFLLEDEPRLFSFAWQVAKGLEFLASLKVIHRDIAARNILLTSDNVAKISDFGLSVDVYQSGYYSQKSKGRLPLKWMGPEAVSTGRFTLQSDVWSYGVLLWELVSLGAVPYPDVEPRLLDNMHRSGYIMPQPKLCPDILYTLMRQCWEYEPSMRPSFTYIVEKLYALIRGSCSNAYVEFECSSVNKDQTESEHHTLLDDERTVTIEGY